jgi:uncharacterized DUF497 family protein
MRFKWDARKAASNLRKHGVGFDEASTVFADELSATGADPEHSLGEGRFLTIGLSSRHRLLVVSHADHDDDIRIISARQATHGERRIYEET